MSRRLIDADALKHYATGGVTSVGILTLAEIDAAPTIDAVEVVRCKDCEYFGGVGRCLMHSEIYYNKPNDFCSYGERKETT